MIQFGLVQFSTVPDASVNKELEYVRFTTLDNTYINFNCFELTSPFADKSRNPSAKKIQSKVSNDTSVPFHYFTLYCLQDAPLCWITFAVSTSASASDGTYHDSQ